MLLKVTWITYFKPLFTLKQTRIFIPWKLVGHWKGMVCWTDCSMLSNEYSCLLLLMDDGYIYTLLNFLSPIIACIYCLLKEFCDTAFVNKV